MLTQCASVWLLGRLNFCSHLGGSGGRLEFVGAQPRALGPTSPRCVRRLVSEMGSGRLRRCSRTWLTSGVTRCEGRCGRVFSASPAWVVLQMRFETCVVHRAESLQARQVSEHSSSVRFFAKATPRARRTAPVPGCVLDSECALDSEE